MRKAVWSLILVAAVLLTVTVIAEAQQPKKIHRIGYLSSETAAGESTRSEAIRLALRELGYIEGQNIAVEFRYGEGKLDRAPEPLAELARLKVDIIVITGGEAWIREAQNATRTTPIVMTGTGSDPVEEGLIESLARPGGNVTGIANITKELGGKRLELLKQTIPKLAQVAVLYNPAAPGSVREVKKDLPEAARALGLTIRSWEIRPPDGFENVFAALNQQRPDGLYVTAGPQMGANRKRFAPLL
jgi:putative tryptophan/tyrosine transport system substrate-binding protein